MRQRIQLPPLEQIPDAAWARAVPSPQHDPLAALAAILKSLDGPTPIRTVRLTAAIMLEPYLLTPVLPLHDQAQWRRLVGQEAEPRSGNVVGFAARTTPGWNAAITNHRGNGRLLEDFTARTWTPGTGLEAFDTAGWPEGRARFALDALRNLDIDATVPDAPLREFETKIKDLPKTTEAERLVVQRIGQDIFRVRLIEYWQGRCPLTGITDTALLRASHIIPWKDCASDAERLDVHNGFLLSALWDAAFDRGLVTFNDEGQPQFSPFLSDSACAELRWQEPIPLTDKHRRQLTWHRTNLFVRQGGA